MSHLDEGSLMAMRDGSSGSAEARAHLASCPACQEALAQAHKTRDAVTAALSALDESFDTGAAREAVRARVTDAAAKGEDIRPITRRARWGGSALARAAGLVLIAAVGASALPRSPVRSWVGSLLSRDVEPAAVVPADAAPGVALENAGIRVSVTAPVRVSVMGLAPGEAVTVLWVPGPEVAVFAASGSRFSSGESGVEATVTHGPVRIELPMNVRPLTLEVSGRIWLRSLSSGVEFLVGPEDETSRPLRYVVPEDGGG